MKRKRIKAAVCAAVMAFTLFGSVCSVDHHFMRETRYFLVLSGTRCGRK